MAILTIVLLAGILVLLLAVFMRQAQTSSGEEARLREVKESQEKLERSVRDEISKTRGEAGESARQLREELSNNVARMSTAQKEQLDSFAKQLEGLTQLNDQRLGAIRETVEAQIKYLQEENSKKLEKMRETVDEKLQSTLEKRLGESFRLVSERLEAVANGLGEMRNLASNVGDLKKVLTNVKNRGTFGELQLANILQDMLTHDQYQANVATREGSRENVEFAIRLPGRDGLGEVLLPVDSKFPKDDFERLIEARDKNDTDTAAAALSALTERVKKQARDIHDKYLNPPRTTDFGIMFLPTEGLYAEVLSRPGLFETLQRDYHVMVTGPTTLAAILNSLQMGFKTLAIEKRSSEVWALLSVVKKEFGNFGAVLEKAHKQIATVANTIEQAKTRTDIMGRKLKQVQELPAAQQDLLPEPAEAGEVEGGETPEAN